MPRVPALFHLGKTLAVFCLLLLPSVVGFMHRGSKRNITYTWRTGDWGSCLTGMEECGEGVQERSVWCADSEGLRAMDQNCDIHSKPKEKIPCLLVCDRIKPYLWWEISDWSPCTLHLQSPSDPVCVEGLGVSTRNVSCFYGPPEQAPREFPASVCESLPDKPATELPCSFDCPRDCVTTEFADHTDCAQCRGPNRTQTRRVLVAPEYGGKPCPDLSQFVPCNASQECVRDDTAELAGDDFLEKFTLRVGQWGACKVGKLTGSTATGKPHQRRGFLQSVAFGLRNRKVLCVDGRGNAQDMRKCLAKAEIYPPVSEQLCLVLVHCMVSPWSEWRVTQEGCLNSLGQARSEVRVRSRKVLRLPQADGQPCPQLVEEKIITDNLPPCDKYEWLPLEWNECALPDYPWRNNTSVGCGDGIQERSVICVKTKDLIPVPENLCFEPRPLELQRCHVTCPKPCQTTPWSVWSDCLPGKRANPFETLANGYRLRSRTVLDPGSDPDSCPHLFEWERCVDPDRFTWTYGPWGACQLNANATCGAGDQNRTANCKLLNGELTSVPYCRIHVNIPETSEACYVPCPEDCVLSEWSFSICSQPCFHDDKSGIMKMTRSILARAGEGGKECDPELNYRDECNSWSCEGYRWKEGPWGPCKLASGHRAAGGQVKPNCGPGNQTRKVVCSYKDEGGKKGLCNPANKPKESRECNIECPVDCRVTEFSDWSQCSDKCSQDTNQGRKRYVIQRPSHGGAPCPQILEEWRSCYEDNNPACYRPNGTYKWVTDKWSDCKPLARNGKKCGPGFQIRDVYCQASGSHPVEPWHCLQQKGHNPPEQIRGCDVLCGTNCSLTDWIPKSTCQESCGNKIQVERIAIGEDKNSKECEQINQARLRDCPPVEEATEQGPWQDCLLEGEEECGKGIRYRIAPSNETPLCHQTGIQKESCEVDCPVDCQMSVWSSWSQCNTRCGQGYRERSRTVDQEPNSLGRPCPTSVSNGTEEAEEVCENSCDDYIWMDEGWSTCSVHSEDKNVTCGTGTQNRKVRCVVKQIGHPSQSVQDDKCDASEKPTSTQECSLPCPGDCVVSQWGPWSNCQTPCKDKQERVRSRKVLRQPSADGNSCPHLTERENCSLGVNCFKFSWVLGPWGSCSLPDGALCGGGVRRRALMCQSSKDGGGVSTKLCQDLPPVLEEHLVQNCSLPCPVDCKVSPWSEWETDDCQPCAKQGLQVRRRRMVRAPSSTGRPCPSLFQNKPCPFSSCYHWEIGDWSKCEVQAPGQCGYGIQRRDVVCRRSDGVRVDEANCIRVNASTVTRLSWMDEKWLKAALDVKNTLDCHIPCPGDCLMSEWTDWGHCARDCNNILSVGYQTRSRSILSYPESPDAEPCPQDLYETKPCWGGHCLTFEWNMVDGELKCQRSDGLLVSGAGCSSGSGSGGGRGGGASSSACPHPCTVPESVCHPDTGRCLCRRGTTPNHDPVTKELTQCTPMDAEAIRTHNHTGHDIVFKYFPDDNEASFWMYAMISVGTAFVIFVVVTIYLMCHSSLRERLVDVRRQGNMRRRPPLPTCDLSVLNGTPKAT